jgi:protein required for attachment to host cells
MGTTWIVIADGARARVIEQDRESRAFKPAFEQEFFGQPAQSREIASDRPGRSFDSAGEGRHAMEPPTDPQRHAKYEFAGELARHLQKAAAEHRFERLLLIAAPKTLGDLRELLPEAVRKKIVAELDKDRTKVPTRDLADHLDAALLRG